MTAGKFIVFEGPDGSGKSSAAREVALRLRAKGHNICATYEPSCGPIGAFIRDLLKGRASLGPTCRAQIMAMLMEADRLDHMRNDVVPKLEQGISIICDRYLLSNLVYQSVAVADAVEAGTDPPERVAMRRQIAEKRFRAWLEVVATHVPLPDMQLHFRAPVGVLLERIRTRGVAATIYENEEYLGKVNALYERASELLYTGDAGQKYIDATQPFEVVVEKACTLVEAVLKE